MGHWHGHCGVVYVCHYPRPHQGARSPRPPGSCPMPNTVWLPGVGGVGGGRNAGYWATCLRSSGRNNGHAMGHQECHSYPSNCCGGVTPGTQPVTGDMSTSSHLATNGITGGWGGGWVNTTPCVGKCGRSPHPKDMNKQIIISSSTTHLYCSNWLFNKAQVGYRQSLNQGIPIQPTKKSGAGVWGVVCVVALIQGQVHQNETRLIHTRPHNLVFHHLALGNNQVQPEKSGGVGWGGVGCVWCRGWEIHHQVPLMSSH